MKIGSQYNEDGTSSFTVWAPMRKSVSVKTLFPEERIIPMNKEPMGYWHISGVPVLPGTRYVYQLDENLERPDPASCKQPFGVNGPSEIIDHAAFRWNDAAWRGVSPEEMVIYELHVGTFSPEGTFDGILKKLDHLLHLGVTAIEVMPLAQFPGERNWGYDGAYPYAVQISYGGPEGFKRFVDECHCRGVAVIVDVVYNHLGPEGTYVFDYGPYFTERYITPWGAAVNFDEAWSYGVRHFFIQNALSWFELYHIDALRLDAIQGIFDFGAKHILKELAEETDKFSKESGRKRYLIAESDLNDIRVITPIEENGYGIDAQWNDDFHHSIHALLTGEQKSYYGDYGTIDHLEKAYREGFVYTWSFSQNRKRHHGSSSAHVSGKQLVICLQNHDQIGNRLLGERLSMLVPLEALKLAAGALFTAPYIPLLFMGEEFAAKTPFFYFISHSDEHLVQSVREGRAREFAELHFGGEPLDPQNPATFEACKLDWGAVDTGMHAAVLSFYHTMIEIRKKTPALCNINKENMHVSLSSDKKVFVVQRWFKKNRVTAVMNFSGKKCTVSPEMIPFSGEKIIDSADSRWSGPGAAMPEKTGLAKEYNLTAYNYVLYATA